MELNKTLRTTLIVICVIIIVLNLVLGKKFMGFIGSRTGDGAKAIGGGVLVFILSVVGLGFLLIFTEEKKDNK